MYKITLKQGNMLNEKEADFVVNASNTELNEVSGISMTINRICGHQVQKEIDKYTPISQGEVIATSCPKNPNYKTILHVGIMDYTKENEETSLDTIKTALKNIAKFLTPNSKLLLPIMGIGEKLDREEVVKIYKDFFNQDIEFNVEVVIYGYKEFEDGENNKWIDVLIKWADENNLSEEDFPRDKNKLQNLDILSLEDYTLTYLPKEIGNLKNLEYLSVYSSNLTHLPDEIGNLENLEFLILCFNQLEELPKSIGKLKNLVTLQLNSNQLKKLPKEIGDLENLMELYLCENPLKELPDEIIKLKNLQEIMCDCFYENIEHKDSFEFRLSDKQKQFFKKIECDYCRMLAC